jgi:hypothetical protein
MNRPRDPNKSPATLWMTCSAVVFVILAAAGGVRYAISKNRQVEIRRDIDALEKRVEQCRLEIRTTEMRMDQLLNRFAIRKQLAENGSKLRPIPLSAVEEAGPDDSAADHGVVSSVP